MSKDPKNPDVGDLIIDASNLAAVVVDLPPGGRVGLRVAQQGCASAVAEVRSNQAKYGVTAGIRDEDIVALDEAMSRIDEIDGLLPPALKLVELLQETRAVLDDSVQRRITMIASTIEHRSRMMRSDDLLARYATARAYRSAIGQKALRTRLRNQANDDQANDDQASQPGDSDVGEPADSDVGEPAGESPLNGNVPEALPETTGELSGEGLAASAGEASQG